VFGMSVVLFFVFRSMSRHLRKVREAARQEAAQAEQTENSEPGDMRGPGADRMLSSDYDRLR